MNDNLLVQTCNKNKRKLKYNKPFWNDELTALWKEMVRREKSMTKSRNGVLKRQCMAEFKSARHNFDRRFRFYERQYKRGLMDEIEDLCTTDPKQFDNNLKKLGPRSNKKPIPWET